MSFIATIKKFSLATIIVSLVLGVLFLVFAEQSVEYASVIFGAALISVSIIGIVTYLITKRGAFTLALNIIVLIFGILICAKFINIVNVIVGVLGVIMIAFGLFNLIVAIRVIAGSILFGWATLVMSVITTVFGAIAITKTSETSVAVFRLLGVALVFYAVMDIIAFIQVKRLSKMIEKKVQDSTEPTIEATAEYVE